ncbi:MAG: 3-oxoacyl-[acyl-carrier-protein] reductase [bacterium]
MPPIHEQNIIVTGANRGIGRSMTEHFLDKGATVGLLGRREEALNEAVEEIEEELSPPGTATTITADVSDFDQVSEAIENWVEEHDTVHSLVNNAGITRDGLLMRMKDDDWESVMNVNLDGAFYCTKSVIRPMMRNRWGRIVMMSSVIGLMGNGGQVNYAASKSGMIGLGKSVAKELGSRNVTCNIVAPGYIKTEMTEEMDDETKETLLEETPAERLGDTEDVSACVEFLLSEKAGFITGEVIRVDGGLAM